MHASCMHGEGVHGMHATHAPLCPRTCSWSTSLFLASSVSGAGPRIEAGQPLLLKWYFILGLPPPTVF